MDEAEVTKICRSCGEDLRHKKRRKDRDGTYLCPNCIRAANRWDRRLLAALTDKKTQRLALYVVLAVLAGVIFWSILDVINQAGSPSP
jgi:hypothetical protein